MMSGLLPIIMFSIVPCQYDLTAHHAISRDEQRLGLGIFKKVKSFVLKSYK